MRGIVLYIYEDICKEMMLLVIKGVLNNDIVRMITNIEQNKFTLNNIKLPAITRNKLRKNSKKKSSYASNKIEGNPRKQEPMRVHPPDRYAQRPPCRCRRVSDSILIRSIYYS